MPERRHNFQTISWFWDLYKRVHLNLDPPYQRRSVWNQEFKEYFIDTVLLGYPAPSLFVYEEISPDGNTNYNVVDGKQRLSTIFEFLDNIFSVSDRSELTELRGKYFQSFTDDLKRSFFGYQFAVEYLPTSDEQIINAIFDRINRNVAKLTPQELRHAKYSGRFISKAEELTQWMQALLPHNVPRLTEQTRKQMKDVETVAGLLLLIEEGPKGYSQADLDAAFSDRDTEWEPQTEVESVFRSSMEYVSELFKFEGGSLVGTRMKNQADFYSLFGAIVELYEEGALPSLPDAHRKLRAFCEAFDDILVWSKDAELEKYFNAARSASNDKGPREFRIGTIKRILST